MKKTYWTLANLFSVGNAFFGILSLFNSFENHLKHAALFILMAVLFDFLDGKTARAMNQTSMFGKSLDSLSDMISFGVAPALLGYVGLSHVARWMQLLIATFVLCGAWRLAYYIQWREAYRPPGMAITFNGLIFPLLFFLHGNNQIFLMFYAISIGLMVGPIFWSRPTIT